MKFVAALITLSACVSAASAEKPAQGAGDSTAQFVFPGFDLGASTLRNTPALRDALNGAPGVTQVDTLFPWTFGNGDKAVSGFTCRVRFDPKKGDVGDVAKAVAALKAADGKEQPSAILLVRLAAREGATEKQLEAVWERLSKVKGVDVRRSRQLEQASIVGVVLDGAGGAKLAEVVAAFEAAKVPVKQS